MSSSYANPGLNIYVLGNVYSKNQEKPGPELFFSEIEKKLEDKAPKLEIQFKI